MTRVVMRDRNDNVVWEREFGTGSNVSVDGQWLMVDYNYAGEVHHFRIKKKVRTIVLSFE